MNMLEHESSHSLGYKKIPGLSRTPVAFFQKPVVSQQCLNIDKHQYTTHTHPYGPFTRTTQVTRYQKGKTSLDFTEARDSEWQWHQLGHMQDCTSLQTDNHTSTPPLRFLQAGCPSCHPTNSVKALKAQTPVTNHIYSMTAASILEYVFITVTRREETVLTFFTIILHLLYCFCHPHHCLPNSRTLHDLALRFPGFSRIKL